MNSSVVWASGTGGTWLRTLDSGAHWTSGVVAGAADLDFRGIRAWTANTAILLSSGTGEKSRIYKTTDGGARWTLLFTNPDDKVSLMESLFGTPGAASFSETLLTAE